MLQIYSFCAVGYFSVTQNLRNAWITVDDNKCWEFDYTISSPEEIVCNTNLTGRRVAIHKNIPPNEYLSFCEVQIWGKILYFILYFLKFHLHEMYFSFHEAK